MKEEIFARDKIFSHIDKIYDWEKGNENTLITIEFDMTNKCNNKCPNCIGRLDKENKESIYYWQKQYAA